MELLKNFIPTLVVLCILGEASGFSALGLDILNSAGDIISGVASELLQYIPTVSELFSATKQILFGLPEQAVFKAINQLCKYLCYNIKFR